MARTDTQTVEVAAAPDAAFALLADARQLPRWARPFADSVEPTDDPVRWNAVKDGQGFPLRVVAHAAARTVDFLPGNVGDLGGHARVLHRPGGGAVVLFTQPLPADATAAAAARATVAGELQVLRGLLDERPTT